MRLFRRGPRPLPGQEQKELLDRIAHLEETKREQRRRLERKTNEYYAALEMNRRYRTELRQLRSRFSAFAWEQALAHTPEAELIERFVDNVALLTENLAADMLKEEN